MTEYILPYNKDLDASLEELSKLYEPYIDYAMKSINIDYVVNTSTAADLLLLLQQEKVISFTLRNGARFKPYFIHKLAYDLVITELPRITSNTDFIKFVKLIQIENPSNALCSLVYGNDHAINRYYPVIEYPIDAKNMVWRSRPGNVSGYSKLNRKKWVKLSRFMQHGNYTNQLVCCLENVNLESYWSNGLKKTVTNQFQRHHPKVTNGKSDNKGNRNPSKLAKLPIDNPARIIEMMGCLIIETGCHSAWHSMHREELLNRNIGLEWWEHHWSNTNGFKPFILRGEQEYMHVINEFYMKWNVKISLSWKDFYNSLFHIPILL